MVGVNIDNSEVVHSELGEYFVRIIVYERMAKFHWNLIYVYADAQSDGTTSFLAELARVHQDNSIPCLVGGDFNIIRKSDEKTNPLSVIIRALF